MRPGDGRLVTGWIFSSILQGLRLVALGELEAEWHSPHALPEGRGAPYPPAALAPETNPWTRTTTHRTAWNRDSNLHNGSAIHPTTSHSANSMFPLKSSSPSNLCGCQPNCRNPGLLRVLWSLPLRQFVVRTAECSGCLNVIPVGRSVRPLNWKSFVWQ